MGIESHQTSSAQAEPQTQFRGRRCCLLLPRRMVRFLTVAARPVSSRLPLHQRPGIGLPAQVLSPLCADARR